MGRNERTGMGFTAVTLFACSGETGGKWRGTVEKRWTEICRWRWRWRWTEIYRWSTPRTRIGGEEMRAERGTVERKEEAAVAVD